MRKVSLTKIAAFLAVLVLAAGQYVFAKEDTSGHKFAIRVGPEFNMNSRENFAGGVVLGFDFCAPSKPLSFGMNVTGSYNFYDTDVIELAPFLRWYFPGIRHSGFFIQADGGYHFIIKPVEDSYPMIMGGLSGGYRVPLGSFYIEPYGRIGYPFFFGIGTITGIRF